MSKVKKIREKVIIDISGYVDPNTGEVLPDGSRIIREKKSGTVTIDYDNYSILSSDAVFYLSKVLNKADLGRLFQMSAMTATPLNLLMDKNNHFHSNKTLQKSLEIGSKSTFFLFISRLIKHGVLYQIKGRIKGSVRVVYMLNPFFSRKRKTFDEKIVEVFTDIFSFKDKGIENGE